MMRFDFEFGTNPHRQRPTSDGTLKILVLADLMGASASKAPPVHARPVVTIDVDTFDEGFARFAPSVSLPDVGLTAPTGFAAIDDFHPDRLYERLEIFDRLRSLRARLQNPATFRAAADELSRMTPPAGAHALQLESPGGEEDTFQRLLGASGPSTPTPATSAAHPLGDTIEAYLRAVVAPHIVARQDPQVAQLVSSVDGATADAMRTVLHHPSLQLLEATWRGVRWLLARGGDLDDANLELHLLHVTRDEVLSHGGPDGPLARRLAPHGADDSTWSVVIADVLTSPSDEDMEMIGVLARIASNLGVPLLAGARGTLVGCEDVSTQDDPATWTNPVDASAGWNRLRAQPEARFLAVVWPRMLIRLPYGANTEPVDSFPFEELPAAHRHEDYLWTNGAFAAALVMARQRHGRADGLEVDIDDLPAVTYRERGEPTLKPCAELLLPERAVQLLLARGITPLMSYRNRNAVRLVGPRSITLS
jgi:type VI secretion system protein ImpC